MQQVTTAQVGHMPEQRLNYFLIPLNHFYRQMLNPWLHFRKWYFIT